MFTKIDVTQIITDHIRTLRNFKNGRISGWDLLLFFGVPVAAAALILFGLGTTIDRAASNILITSLSVFAGLLLNLLMLLYDLVMREEQETGPQEGPSLRAQLLREIFANISYSIVVAVFCIAILLIAYLDIPSDIFQKVFSFIVYALVIQFLLTQFMVLKRVHVLLSTPFLKPMLPKPKPRPRLKSTNTRTRNIRTQAEIHEQPR